MEQLCLLHFSADFNRSAFFLQHGPEVRWREASGLYRMEVCGIDCGKQRLWYAAQQDKKLYRHYSRMRGCSSCSISLRSKYTLRSPSIFVLCIFFSLICFKNHSRDRLYSCSASAIQMRSFCSIAIVFFTPPEVQDIVSSIYFVLCCVL